MVFLNLFWRHGMASSHRNQRSLSSLCWACSHSKKSPFFMVQSGSVSISQKKCPFTTIFHGIDLGSLKPPFSTSKNHHFSAGDRLLHPLFGEAAHREERHLKALATRQWCKWWADDSLIYTRWCPKTLAKLVPVTPITMTHHSLLEWPSTQDREHWGSRQSRLRYLKCSRPTRIPSRITHWLHSGTVEGRATLHTTGVRVGRSGISWPHSSTFAECISGRCYQALNVEDGYIMIYR